MQTAGVHNIYTRRRQVELLSVSTVLSGQYGTNCKLLLLQGRGQLLLPTSYVTTHTQYIRGNSLI